MNTQNVYVVTLQTISNPDYLYDTKTRSSLCLPMTGQSDSHRAQFHNNIRHILVHDDVIKWKHFPRYWPCVRGIHRSPVNSPHKGQWRGTLMFPLICVRINGWINNPEAGDLRRHHAHCDVIVMPGFKAIDDFERYEDHKHFSKMVD